jgi:hypothetical protein
VTKKPAPKTTKPAVKTVKPAAKKAVAKKPVTKAASKKVAVKKPVAKVAPGKTPIKKPASKKDKADPIQNLVTKRNIDLKSIDEALGIKYDNTKDHEPIPGKFDMIIPPGTPRKLIVNMAKEFNLEIAQRNDYYVPIGVSDTQRELLVFRGDRKTIEKVSKEFLKRLKAWAK